MINCVVEKGRAHVCMTDFILKKAVRMYDQLMWRSSTMMCARFLVFTDVRIHTTKVTSQKFSTNQRAVNSNKPTKNLNSDMKNYKYFSGMHFMLVKFFLLQFSNFKAISDHF